MRDFLNIKRSALALGVGLVMGTSGAHAALITSFDFTQEFEWVKGTAVPASVAGSGETDGVSDVDGWTKLEWGTATPAGSNNLSSIVVNPEAGDRTTPSNDLTQGTINVSMDINAVDFEDGPSVTHNNWVITGNSLTSTDAQDFVRLTPQTPPNPAGPAQEQTVLFDIRFEETVNGLSQAACPSVWDATNGCGDIFVLLSGGVNLPVEIVSGAPAFQIDQFDRDGFLYTVFLREKTGNLFQLDGPANSGPPGSNPNPNGCSAAGAAQGCVGFQTFENQENFFALEFGILAQEREVPAPASLFLIGGGLWSLAWMRRRRSKA